MRKSPPIDADAGVQAIARGLGIEQGRDLGAAIRDVTIGRVEGMLRELRVSRSEGPTRGERTLQRDPR